MPHFQLLQIRTMEDTSAEAGSLSDVVHMSRNLCLTLSVLCIKFLTVTGFILSRPVSFEPSNNMLCGFLSLCLQAPSQSAALMFHSKHRYILFYKNYKL